MPLTGAIQALPRFCYEQGRFLPRRTLFRLATEEQSAVEAELAAQIQACIDGGIQPTHLDSHQHVHSELADCGVVIRLAQRFGIKAVRLTRNCGPGISLVHKLYKAAYNNRLRMHGLAKTRIFLARLPMYRRFWRRRGRMWKSWCICRRLRPAIILSATRARESNIGFHMISSSATPERCKADAHSKTGFTTNSQFALLKRSEYGESIKAPFGRNVPWPRISGQTAPSPCPSRKREGESCG